MQKGKLKKMFPGNNTGEGFYSFYHFINPAAVRTFILKGGPGTGKSTLMKKIGAVMREKGYDAEYHYCSSDNTSLDGLVFPALRIAIIDGTAPHLVDPKAPGAIDEIINLGEFWREEALFKVKEQIKSINKKKAQMFQAAYSYLKEAKVAQDELESYYQEALNPLVINRMFYDIYIELLAKEKPQFARFAALRRLFASANTPGGYVHYFASILQDACTLYLLEGEPVTEKEELLELICRLGNGWGLTCEAYHCPFIPTRLELVYFPGRKTGLLRVNEPLRFDAKVLPKLKNCTKVDFNQCLNFELLKVYEPEIREAKKRITSLRQSAWDKLKAAQKYHAELEKCYFAAIDFTGIEQKTEELLKKILAYTKGENTKSEK